MMTVKIVNRFWNDKSFRGLRIETVKIKPVCPECGGPRGTPKDYCFFEDGETHACNTWNNPCGHVDSYENVYKEATEGQKNGMG